MRHLTETVCPGKTPGLFILFLLLIPAAGHSAGDTGPADADPGPAAAPEVGDGYSGDTASVRSPGPGSPGSEVIHFAAAADQHYGYMGEQVPPFDDVTVDDWMSHPDLPGLDFVFASMGDWISDNRHDESWQDPDHVWSVITGNNADHMKMPYFWVYGNHDITNYDNMTDGNPVRKERTGRAISGMNENNYAFMYNNVLFICVSQTNAMTDITGFQKSWLEYLLDRYHDRTTVMLAHQATYETTGAGTPKSTSWSSADYHVHNDLEFWRPLFDSNPQIKLYIHGHTETGCNTTFHDDHPGTWDDQCTFVLVPSNGRGYFTPSQSGWSYVFTIADDHISVRLWDSVEHRYIEDDYVGVPYNRTGMDNMVTAGGMEWYSTPKRVLDGQEWEWTNRMMAEKYSLELVGSNRTEQIDNPELDACHESDEEKGAEQEDFWRAVRGDENALNKATGERDGFIKIAGGHTLELAMSPSNPTLCIEGKVPYNTAMAIPGKTYNFTCRIRTTGGEGAVDYRVSIPRYLDIRDLVWYNHTIRPSFTVNQASALYWQTFTVPPDGDAWFIQPKIYFHEGAVYRLESWSLKMVGSGNLTSDFSVTLNGKTFRVTGDMPAGSYSSFGIPGIYMDNTLGFNCSIGGNRVGMVRLIYDRPQLWSDDVSFGVRSASQDRVYLKDVSPYNNRTTVMSFMGGHFGISGFSPDVVRAKYCFLLDACDSTLESMYVVNTAMELPDIRKPTFGEDTSPPEAGCGEPYRFSVVAFDPSGILALQVEYWFGSDSHKIRRMEHSGNYTFTIDIPRDSTTSLFYAFHACDMVGNRNDTEVREIPVKDFIPPTFVGDDTPDNAHSGESVEFRATVVDNIKAEKVRITYWYGFMMPRTIAMSKDGKDRWAFTTTIPEDNEANLHYLFRAWDASGNTNVSGNGASETIVVVNTAFVMDHTPGTATTGDPHTFNMTLDETFNLTEVRVVFWHDPEKRTSVGLDLRGHARHTIDIPDDETDTLYYRFHAVDFLEYRYATDKRSVTIVDNDPPVFGPAPDIDAGETGEPVTLTANATDNTGVPNVEAVFRTGDDPWTTRTMDGDGPFSTGLTLPLDSAESLEYYFRATDIYGNNATSPVSSLPVHDVIPPAADAGTDAGLTPGVTHIFQGGRSADNIGVINHSWHWTYGSGEVMLHGESPSFAFDRPGTWDINLTVYDSSGNAGVDTVQVTVGAGVPVNIGPFLTDEGAPVLNASLMLTAEDGTAIIGRAEGEGLFSLTLPFRYVGDPVQIRLTAVGYDPLTWDTSLNLNGSAHEPPPLLSSPRDSTGGDDGHDIRLWALLLVVPAAMMAAHRAMAMRRRRGSGPGPGPEQGPSPGKDADAAADGGSVAEVSAGSSTPDE